MNAIKTLKLASGAVIVVTSINSWGQSSEPAATSTGSDAAATSQGMSKSDVRKANRALSKKVLTALSKSGVDTAGVSVLVKGSAITLAGSVPEAAQVEKAVTAAKGVSGVSSVSNALSIKEKGAH
ncbi:transport-associated protein [Caballeronia calidae]|uniref:Transport-associated protein n=1 Tax=Caballeronia calidae TaxID=1777139 RepID=A0A158EGG1_9BURK|nr:BON domain-containing protein [Caballeronia calidae]SAL05496.1 transport-associated protein [Caballeronia calidae]